MNLNEHIHHTDWTNIHYVTQLLLTLPFLSSLILYIFAVALSNRRHKLWPIYRTICWTSGIFFAVIAVIGPLANRAHIDFITHMLTHLFLGMLAPLLMVLAAPMTLILRTLSVPLARRLSLILKSWPARLFTHPIVTSFLNIGGLWILYTTELYSLMHESPLLHLFIHFHVFVAGYLFTISIIYIDPIPHRIPFLYRTIVFIIAIAGHNILSKYLYAHPPNGVPLEQAEFGGMLMYYGGDAIDIVIIYILCLQWFKATRPRIRLVSVR